MAGGVGGRGWLGGKKWEVGGYVLGESWFVVCVCARVRASVRASGVVVFVCSR